MESKVFPNLISGHQIGENHYHIDMFYQEEPTSDIPIIVFSLTENDYVKNPDDHGLSGGQMVKEAFQNLARVSVVLTPVSSGEATILVAENQEYAAEKLLDKTFLMAAAAELKAEKILVGIPVRGTILIGNQASEESVALFEQKLNALYNSYSNSQISALVYVVEQGVISATYHARSANSVATEDISFPASYQWTSSKVTLFESLYNVKLFLSADSIDDFINGMFGSILKTLLAHVGQPHFNGTLEIQSELGKPGKNQAMNNAVEKFFHKLTNNSRVLSIIKKSDAEIKISFIHGEDFRQGDVHKKIITHLSNSQK